jgi:hypothetical protein
MMATIISAGTPVSASTLASASRCSARNLRPSAMRCGVMKMGR